MTVPNNPKKAGLSDAITQIGCLGAFIFMALGFLVTTLYCLGMAGYIIVDGWRSTGWESARGTVTEAFVRTSKSHGSGRYGGGGSTTVFYEPVVRYTYEVGMKQHHGNHIYLVSGENSVDRKWAYETIDRYTKDKSVSVHYNPAKPAESALEVGVSWLRVRQMCSGALLWGVCSAISFWILYMFILFTLEKRGKRPQLDVEKTG